MHPTDEQYLSSYEIALHSGNEKVVCDIRGTQSRYKATRCYKYVLGPYRYSHSSPIMSQLSHHLNIALVDLITHGAAPFYERRDGIRCLRYSHNGLNSD